MAERPDENEEPMRTPEEEPAIGDAPDDEQPDPKPASGEPVKSDEFAHANDDD